MVAALALTAAVAWAGPAKAADAAQDRGPALGSIPPDFTLQGPDGRTVSLARFRGRKPVVLVFFRGTW
jgi:cytochrome oxidase Cu insertion factor (SCO1/SenC/PrrC family)